MILGIKFYCASGHIAPSDLLPHFVPLRAQSGR